MSAARAAGAPLWRSALWLALLVAVFAVLVGLGTWQVQRLHWKEGLLASIDQRIHSAPLPLADIERRFAETHDVDYTPVAVAGSFVHEDERHFFATWKGDSGYYVYTPLRLADGRYLFVNRGFVPFDRKDPATRQQGQVEGQVELTGLARNPLPGKPSSLVPDNDPAKNIFYWKDLAAMTATSGLPAGAVVLPFFVDAGPAPNPGGLPVGGVTMVDLPNDHLQYAVTWYGLAGCLVAVAGLWFWRRRHPAADGRP
ncbi:MAG: SURF1 family protein [Rhizobiales bacterium]|nr:SURF1 family protein [Hyphomicrobiales bacterium]OJU31252.1 MAG: cytochrome c oxidase assembly protein [Rhizobiales bacterium 68-8]